MAKNPQSELEILSTDTPEQFEAAVLRAISLLASGEVVALPTETVYGLAANALDPKAVAKIYEIKGRPAHNPIIAHVASPAMAVSCASEWPSLAERLARAFWPGPLTLVLPKAANIPEILTGGGSTVGIRWPSHPFIQAVIRRCGFPLAAPSANLANRVSPTTARHVSRQLGGKVPLIVDGGPSQVGIESTVLDISVSPPRVLRPGVISAQALLAVTEQLAEGPEGIPGTLKSPGLLEKHYAPRARLILRAWNDDRELRDQAAEGGIPASRIHILAHTRIPSAGEFGGVSVIPHDPVAFARALYAQLHACDGAGAELIIVEALPETDEWKAVLDRLNRAAAS